MNAPKSAKVLPREEVPKAGAAAKLSRDGASKAGVVQVPPQNEGTCKAGTSEELLREQMPEAGTASAQK